MSTKRKICTFVLIASMVIIAIYWATDLLVLGVIGWSAFAASHFMFANTYIQEANEKKAASRNEAVHANGPNSAEKD